MFLVTFAGTKVTRVRADACIKTKSSRSDSKPLPLGNEQNNLIFRIREDLGRCYFVDNIRPRCGLPQAHQNRSIAKRYKTGEKERDETVTSSLHRILPEKENHLCINAGVEVMDEFGALEKDLAEHREELRW